jgi:hypothetical protein
MEGGKAAEQKTLFVLSLLPSQHARREGQHLDKPARAQLVRGKAEHAGAQGGALGVEEDARVARKAQGGAVRAAGLFRGLRDDGLVDLERERRG